MLHSGKDFFQVSQRVMFTFCGLLKVGYPTWYSWSLIYHLVLCTDGMVIHPLKMRFDIAGSWSDPVLLRAILRLWVSASISRLHVSRHVVMNVTRKPQSNMDMLMMPQSEVSDVHVGWGCKCVQQRIVLSLDTSLLCCMHASHIIQLHSSVYVYIRIYRYLYIYTYIYIIIIHI